MSSEKSSLQVELSNLEGKYKVMETLRDSQETELQTLKVKSQDPPLKEMLTQSNFDLYLYVFLHLQMKLSVQESTLTRVQETLRDTQEEVHCLKETVAQQKDELHAGEMERRRLHNTIQELKVS